jgi:eukaryotic-like serine/threonine-protein kinase
MTTKPTHDADRLRSMNALLEAALALPEEEREPWLKTLPDHQQPFVSRLSVMLARAAVESDSFLRWPDQAAFAELAPDAQGPQPGDAIGPYLLIREIGAGGMATVWLAERSDLQRQVALKLPHEGWGPGLMQRVARERNILAALEYPRIARLYDAGVTANGKPWMAMEYVDGSPIDVYCATHRLGVRQRLELFLQVADAVAHAHARLIVHRDLKPTNILVTPEGEVRLLDFGVAKMLEDESAGPPNLTQMMGRAGTPEYASPEQVGGHPIGVATDVYSLGIILYELLVGSRPYRLVRRSAAALEKAILSADVPLASAQVADSPKLAKQLRGDVDVLLATALKKNVAERYSSVESFAADIKRHLDGEPLLARAESRWYRANKFLRRHALPVAAAAAVLVALLAGLAAATWQAREAMRQSVIAREKQARSQASADFTLAVLTEGLRADESLSLDKLVERSEAFAENDFSANPTDRAVAVDTVADWLINNDRYDPALQLLSRTIDALPAEVDPALRRTLRCQRAAARVGLGQPASALQELDEVIAASANDPETSWYCLQRRTSAAILLNDAPGSLRYAQESLRQFERSGNGSPLRRAHLAANAAYAEMLNGRPAKADELFREAVSLLEKAGRADSSLAVSVYNDWSIALWNAGDPRAALSELDRAISITVSRSPDGEDSPSHYGNRAHTLRALGRFEEALTAFEHMQQMGNRDKNPNYEAYALAGEAIIAVQLGRLDQAAVLLKNGQAVQQKAALPPDGPPSLWLHVAQAALWQAQGRLTEADRALAEIQAQYARLQTKTGVVAETSINRAEIEIALGRIDDAQIQARQALELARNAQGDLNHSFLTGRAYLALGKSCQAKGEIAAARDAYRQASENLRSTLGDSHQLSREADRLAKALQA